MRIPPIRWRPGMSVDGGLIDADHRHLIDIINAFSQHRAEGHAALPHAMDTLSALKFYAETHFAREEQLQTLVKFREHQQHHEEHRQLMASLDGIISTAQAAATIDGASDVVEHLATLLRHWLLNHTLTEDLRMKPYAAAMKAHAATLPPLQSVQRVS
jgi:hemerythrin